MINMEEFDMADSIRIETVTTKSFSMNYFKFGHGERTLVMIPGLSVQSVMGLADIVVSAYESMTNDFTIYLFDRRTDIPNIYETDDMARDTAEAIKALGLGPVDLFGASQGGMISMKIAVDCPELVNKLVLASTSAKIEEREYDKLLEWIDLAVEGDAEALYLSFGESVYPQEVFEQSRQLLIDAAKTVTQEDLDRFIIFVEGMRDYDVRTKLKNITCPVLLTGSYDDKVLGPDATAFIAACLEDNPGFTLHMYDGYGHAAYDTAPDFKDRMMSFLLT